MKTRPVALITGAAGGIGRAVAVRFAADGYDLVLVDQDRERLVVVVSELKTDAVVLIADLTHELAVQNLVNEAFGSCPRIDVLIYCAGTLGPRDLFETTSGEWDEVFAVNVRSTFIVVREIGQAMREAGGGCIIALASVAAKEARDLYVPYNASKAAVLNLIWSTARILGPFGVRAHALCPGPVDTQMWEQLANADPDGASEAREARRAQIPMGRFASPDDVAAAARFLASDEAAYLTGLSLDVAGGARLGMGS